MAYEIEIDGQRYMVDDSDLQRYVNPATGELEIDVFANDFRGELGEQEEPAKIGMDAETKADFDDANKTLRDLSYMTGARGDNAGGALRNLAMGVIPGTAEAEAALRATKQYLKNIDPTASEANKTNTSWGEDYDKYLENARASRKGYAIANPTRAMALQLGGGLAGSLIPFGMATKGASLGSAMLRSGATGLGTGAAFGFGNSEGGLENRLGGAVRGGLLGGSIGLGAPVAASIIGGVGNTAMRLGRGWGKKLPQGEVEGFMLDKTLKPTTESRRMASTLGYGSARGASEIEDAAYDLYKLKETMNKKIKPASYGGKTAGGTSAQDFLKATQVPSLTEAKKAFGDFVESVPTVENPTRPAQAILEKLENNKTALRILDENADNFLVTTENGVVKPMDPGTFEYWQRIQQILSNKLPKKYNPARLTGERKEIYDAIQELSNVREKLFKGTKKINNQYSDAIADQAFADSQLSERLRAMSRQKEPQSLPGGIAPTAGWLFGPARQRGLSRELIRRGELRPLSTGKGYRNTGSTLDSILRMLENLQ